MSFFARFARVIVWGRFGRASVEADIVTDYLEADSPDWTGAWRAWRTFSRQSLLQLGE